MATGAERMEMTGDAKQPRECDTYEDVTRHILREVGNQLGLDLSHVSEGRQKILGESGMEWTLDATGVKAQDGSSVVIECRRLTTSGIKAEAVMGFAGRITDVRATGGYLVSPLGLQSGAELVAKHKGVHSIRLDAKSTLTDFTVEFLDKVVHGRSANLVAEATLTAEAVVVKPDGTVR